MLFVITQEHYLAKSSSIAPHHEDVVILDQIGRIVTDEQDAVSTKLGRRHIDKSVAVIPDTVMLGNEKVADFPNSPSMHASAALGHRAMFRRQMALACGVTVVCKGEMERGARQVITA